MPVPVAVMLTVEVPGFTVTVPVPFKNLTFPGVLMLAVFILRLFEVPLLLTTYKPSEVEVSVRVLEPRLAVACPVCPSRPIEKLLALIA